MTKEQINGGLQVVQAIAEAIRELKQVPSGKLYAMVMGKLSLEQYEKVIQILVDARLVKKHQSHLLEWIG
jgi:transcriptional regulator CtsR